MSLFFNQPGVWLGWGLRTGEWTGEEIAAKVAGAGFKWVCQEFGDPNTQPTPDEVAALRSACHTHGLYYGIWEVNPQNLDVLQAATPNFWGINLEHHDPIYATLLPEFRAIHPTLPACVITNDDFDPAPFIKANVRAVPEAYQNANPQATPAAMVQRTKGLGYTYVFPVLGVWNGYPLSSYVRAGDGYSVYIAEEMLEADWGTAKTWNT